MKKQAHNHFNRKLNESDGAAAKPTGVGLGEFVTETFEYDGGRRVTVYVPPDYNEILALVVIRGSAHRAAIVLGSEVFET
jgi:hypothetical protein